MIPTPLFNKVFIARDEVETGRIVLPDIAKGPEGSLALSTGTVVAVGHGRMNADGSMTPLKVKTGDRVIYGRYAGQDVEVVFEGVKHRYFVIKEEDLHGILPAERARRVRRAG